LPKEEAINPSNQILNHGRWSKGNTSSLIEVHAEGHFRRLGFHSKMQENRHLQKLGFVPAERNS
jgi:hypothetical protein